MSKPNIPYSERKYILMKKLPKGGVVIDFGFGCINNLTDLKKSYDFVLGIDDFPLTPYYREASDSAIERLFKQNIRVIKADYNNVVSQLKPSSVADVIVMFNSWCFVTKPYGFAKQLYRISKKGRYLYILQNDMSKADLQSIKKAGWKLLTFNVPSSYNGRGSDEYLFIK